MSHDVFISYSVKDKSIADATCAFLEARGIRCWIAPRDVLPGQEYAEALVGGITRCRLMILILSASSNQSPQVLREVERAVSKGLPIIPVRIEDVRLSPSMEYFVSTHHWLDALTSPLEQHLVRLGDTVSLLLQSQAADRTRSPAYSTQPLSAGPRSGPSIPAVPEMKPGVARESSPGTALDDLAEDEYGGGTPLTTTGFLVFGILTLWIYNVQVYYVALKKHFDARLSHFLAIIREETLPDRTRHKLEEMKKEGFSLTAGIKKIALALYGLSVALLTGVVIAMHLLGAGLIREAFFDPFALVTTCLLVFSFCLASILFLSWVVRTIKRHEYNELLLFRLSRRPGEFKAVSPSTEFVEKWSRYQNRVTLFLVLGVPMTFSPVLAAFHVLSLLNRAGNHEAAVIIWMSVIFLFGLIFHVWGTKLLLAMYNEHLHFERANLNQEPHVV